MNFRRFLKRPRSLKWRLVWRMVVLQVVLLSLLIALIIGALVATGVIPEEFEGRAFYVLSKSVKRNADGGLFLQENQQLKELREEVPDLWFIIRDEEGHELSEGTVPPLFSRMSAALDHIDNAMLVWRFGEKRPAATVQWHDTKAGRVQIFTGAQGVFKVSILLDVTPDVFMQVILPVGGVMAVATLMVIPLVVRGLLRGLRRAAARAEHIDIDERGVRLPVAGIPTEIEPLVKAVNDALDRLDAGYERHKRFLTDAAHELRTPVAILSTRIASLPATPDRSRLIQDAARLATLTDQLLDLQRLSRQEEHFERVDLVAAAQGVVADLAPIAFGAGYEMAFEAAPGPLVTTGDRMSIERAVTNLVQNAIEHGGNDGKITVSVAAPATIEVADEGGGVPSTEREKIFQPFYRLRPRDWGAGLGLNLVAEIMQLHGGRIELATVEPDGARFRMVFKPAV